MPAQPHHKKICIALLGVLCTCLLQAQESIQQQALSASVRVADKLIRDTRFRLDAVPQKEELGMQVIDFRDMITTKDREAFAVRRFTVVADSLVGFGISHEGQAIVSVNGSAVYSSTNSSFTAPKEYAYNRFHFQKTFRVLLKKGTNEISIRYVSTGNRAVVFLRAQNAAGDADNTVKFEKQWQLLGAFAKNDAVTDPGKAHYLSFKGKYYTWQSLPQRMIPQLQVDSTLTYFRDPYLDWNYSNGNTVWSAMMLDGATTDPKYRSYVKAYTGFMMDHLDYFRAQYDSLFVWRGSFHRFFRMSMLDDAGSAVLPYLDLYAISPDEAIKKKILDPVADYILHKQVRLSDGTYCRPEPVEYTVWCDDLFMSVPFLLRWAEITNNVSLYDEAVKQFNGFRKYLLDPQTGLFHHGWFSHTQQRSPVRWGRANGWIAWATMELLERLPASHRAYTGILEAFRSQMNTLRQYQESNGMWHQVLDKPASFEETSCTAMFTMAMAKGVRKGWINNSFREAALKGWKAVQSKIDADGTVHDICRGTEIGYDDNFYFTRQRFNQDPRGLGSVIAAGIEVSQLK